MRKILLSFLPLALATSWNAAAFAITVPDGCAVPASSAKGRVFYVDPQKGAMSNDGSAARPWRTLAEVLDRNSKLLSTQSHSGDHRKGDHKLYDRDPSAPVKPGDVINLLNGDHGNVQILGAVNKDFITVRAASGQTPRLRSLRVNGASKWIFTGLKIQGAGDGSTKSLPGPGLIDLGRDSWLGPTSDIIISDGSISTEDDSSRWSDVDWVKKPFMAGLVSSATCVTISSNRFYNLRNGIGIEGERTLIAGNKFDNFGNDAIDFVASNVTIRNNTITNSRNTKSEQLHADGMQGWTKGGATNRNITIDGNTIIKTGDPLVSYLQGITIFDGKWDGVTISNNVVVTNHWHGIALYGVANAKVVNNTVVAYDPEKYPTWITVQNAKDGRPSQNVIVRNNITAQLTYSGENVSADHNLVAKRINTTEFGRVKSILHSGRHGDGNVLDPRIYESLMAIDHSKGVYDFRLKPNSPAIASGNPNLAPLTDITGKTRNAPIDIGAYAR